MMINDEKIEFLKDVYFQLEDILADSEPALSGKVLIQYENLLTELHNQIDNLRRRVL